MNKFADSVKSFVNEWALNILILVFGTTTLLQAFIVPTPSMDTTVMVGDHLLVDKLSYAPAGSISRYLLPYTDVKRGDIIVFRYPMNIRENYVKRVMGVPGDHLRIEDKVVYLNGKPLDEPYARHSQPTMQPYRDRFPVTPPLLVFQNLPDGDRLLARAEEMLQHVEGDELVIPDGYYFAMGDNRDNSLDSRYWGLVPRDYIIGKPLFVFWSYDAPTSALVGYSIGHFVDLAANFFTKTRWERTFKLIRGYPIE